jgi:hypothetical protein
MQYKINTRLVNVLAILNTLRCHLEAIKILSWTLNNKGKKGHWGRAFHKFSFRWLTIFIFLSLSLLSILIKDPAQNIPAIEIQSAVRLDCCVTYHGRNYASLPVEEQQLGKKNDLSWKIVAYGFKSVLLGFWYAFSWSNISNLERLWDARICI